MVEPMDPGHEDALEKPDLYVVARFLDKLWHEEGTVSPRWSKSRLQPAVRLNYNVFQRYLRFLEKQGFVTVTDGKRGEKLVALAPPGRAAHERLVRWMRDVFGQSALDPR